MIERDDLHRVFGAENISTMDFEAAKEAGLSDENLFILTRVGLPRDAGPLFTTDVVGTPELFTAQQYQSDGEDSVAVFLGGPRDDAHMRYFVDVRDGYVVLFAMNEDGTAESEIVNSSLADFLEFVYRFGVRYHTPKPTDPAAERRSVDELAIDLMERDAFAFRRPETWWSMAIDHIRQAAESTGDGE